MSKKRDCVFQYYIGTKCIKDTSTEEEGLITREEAEELWSVYLDHFRNACKGIGKNDWEDAEMAIWVNMKYPTNFRETARHLHSGDTFVVDGVVYEKRLV